MTTLVRLTLAALVLCAGAWRLDAATAAENRAFKAAKSAFEDARWDRAEREFDQFINQYPNCDLVPEAVLLQAQARFRLGQFAEAIALLKERLPAAGDKTDRYLYWIGESQFQSGDFAAAAETFAAVARDFAGSNRKLEASVGEASARARLGEWARVAELLSNPEGIFQRTATNNPGNEWARGWFLLAEAGLMRNDPAAAEAALAPLAASVLKPEQNWQRQQLLTRIALSADRLDDALNQSTNLLLLAGLAARADFSAESSALQGLIYEKLNRPDKAIEAYARNLAPGLPAARQSEALGKIAQLHLAQGQVEEAARKLSVFLERNTNGPAAEVALLTLAELHLKQALPANATNQLGIAEANTNHLFLALALLERFITNSPASPFLGRAQLDRGWCLWLDHRSSTSFEAFAAAAAALPPSEDLAVAQFKTGDAAYAQRNFARARDSYRAALAMAAQFPRAQEALGDLALYQLERACLALRDAAGAEQAMRLVLQAKPRGVLADRSLLLSAQGYAEAGEAARAAELFAEFAQTFPDSELRPEAELAAARASEEQSDWPGALARYEAWLARFTNHALLPDVQFYQARATFQAGNETNALNLFTNFVTRFPSHPLVPAAEFWLGDHFYRQGDFPEAEKHFKLLYQYWPKSPLAFEACMMAGRSAIGWQNYKQAIGYFTNLTGNANCPAALKIDATFAYGGSLMLLDEVNVTNKLANLRLAIEVFGTIYKENPGTDVAARAWGEIGNCYLQLGAMDPQFYEPAAEAYRQVTNIPTASPAVMGLAKVGIGLVLEKQGALSPAAESPTLARQALDQYLDVLYDETGDPFCRKKAGLEALRLGQSLGEWTQVERLCKRLQEMFPVLAASLEKKRLEAKEKSGVRRD